MRQHIDYRKPETAPTSGYAELTDDMRAGFYRHRRSAGHVYRPIAIWHGPPIDPDSGEELDRSWRWQVLYCGRFIYDHLLVWPVCANNRISRDEYDYLLARIDHAQAHDRRDPFGSKSGHVDWHTASPPF